MLRGISHILSPKPLKILCEMGHSDRIVIANRNFPAESMSRDAHVVHMEGHGMSKILEAILSLFPLDTYVEHPVYLMPIVSGDTVGTPVWDQYMTLMEACDSRNRGTTGHIEWFTFYKEAKKAYATITTNEKVFYTNIMLQEGVVTDQGL